MRDIACLDADEKRRLNQIRGNSYCHLFAFVEEYIIPMVIQHANREVFGDETRLWSLLRFAEEEVKHQDMMKRACAQFEAGFGVPCGLVPGREAVAEAILGSSPLTALLLTSMIEWFVQLHYVEHVRDHERDPRGAATGVSLDLPRLGTGTPEVHRNRGRPHEQRTPEDRHRRGGTRRVRTRLRRPLPANPDHH